MDNFMNYIEVANRAKSALREDSYWEPRYKGYIDAINRIYKIENEYKKHRVLAPIFEYTTLGDEKSYVRFDHSQLRYGGQHIADLRISKDKITLLISDKQAENNKTYFSVCKNIVVPTNEMRQVVFSSGEHDWHSKEARLFRRYFCAGLPEKKNNPEHFLESLVLTEFEKNKSANKSLLHIQPITLGKFTKKRFQFPTVFSASNIKNNELKISQSGGGIDILARRKKGNKTYICVIELKDENKSDENPKIAMKQAIVYSVFIRQLLRSEKAGGQKWYNRFGFSGNLPKDLIIKCAVAMPDISEDDFDFINDTPFLEIGDEAHKDKLELSFINILDTDTGKIDVAPNHINHF